MENYYHMLGLPLYEDDQDAILKAYRNVTAKLRDSMSNNVDVEEELVNLNEGYLVLSDVELKELYDSTLGCDVENAELENAIQAKRERARAFVSSKLNAQPKKKKKSIWPALFCGLMLISAAGSILKTCLEATYDPSVQIDAFYPGEDWERYEIARSFSIHVPKTMEMRHENDEYTQTINSMNVPISSADVVFQQKSLSTLSTDAYSTYARIMINHYDTSSDPVERHNESQILSPEDKRVLKDLVDDETLPFSYVEEPTFRWINIAGTKAIEAKYKRAGTKGPVVCRIYLLPNYDEMVKIIVSYRESDANIWKSDLENVIKTFKWNKLK